MTICGIEFPIASASPRRGASGRSRGTLSKFAWLGIAGPAFAISIGYIDPGNWATDIAAGSFGFRLLWVVLLANLMATALQIAVVKLATLTGVDLATAMARRWPALSPALWCVFQGAAVATDLAEFGGVVLGLQLLLGWNMMTSIAAGMTAVLAVLFLSRRENRRLEAAMLVVLGAVAIILAYQLSAVHPSPVGVATGLLPQLPSIGAVPLIVGIVGATVMPHNLFLHSSLVLKNADANHAKRISQSSFFSKETWFALGVATFVNAAILVLGGTLLGHNGSMQEAYRGLKVAEGGLIALLFGAGLIASGIAASATATVAGDYVFRALAPWKIPPLARRVSTILPAAAALLFGARASDLLIWSQIALALILPVVVVPMLVEYANVHRALQLNLKRPLFLGACAAGTLCIAFDAALLLQPFFSH